jgi:polyhydroxyalkanoate synthesis repressor PhaR
MKKRRVLIKKYGDRRLYDTTASGYVKLEDIARMVRDGIDVKVVDARSGKNLTYIVFSQIILEEARDRETALPLQLLQQLVKASDKSSHEFLSWYLKNTMDLYQKAQEKVRSGLTEAKSAVSSPLEFVRNLLAGQPLPAAPPPSRSSPPHDRAETEELRRRVAQLEARLAQADRPAKPPRRAPKRKRPG